MTNDEENVDGSTNIDAQIIAAHYISKKKLMFYENVFFQLI